MDIGPILKKIRLERHYTLSQVAGKIGSTASLLSQIENCKISPSLHSLESLLKCYSVSLSDFFRQVEQKNYIFLKRSESETFSNPDEGYRLTLLASKLQNNTLESYIVEIDPDRGISLATTGKELNGERLILIFSGQAQVEMSDEVILAMAEGDSANFKSYVPCTIRNTGADVARMLISGMPPIIL
ncbi:MAG TPA: XRE family transcriptional regulator [Spirochaetota bacterium]|nr:XRE family transcriptional regulator [Spirochaetota bacterium]HNT10410.1 XRE family transcriptional regulator [Spirochaetota bacterium]HNV46448.1 XRE family transcriptional regulator [Spirochaetota bacterium]HOS41287.1 XRE family transcriptional regulator [Spirochaetota bacterium]HPU86972.1 XRE family transcriptional regulator [Spirochaetota bacterium]